MFTIDKHACEKLGHFILVLYLQLSLSDQPSQKQPAQYPGKFGVQENFPNIASIKLQYSKKGYRRS